MQIAAFWRTFSQRINSHAKVQNSLPHISDSGCTCTLDEVSLTLKTGQLAYVPARITTGRGTDGPENGTSWQKQDG